jgi:predicted alpha-1,2-mannosidase
MRGRNEDGSFQSPFSPFKWGDAFTEGNSWQWTWCVFHDIKGLIGMMGGKGRFVGMLDSVFVLPPIYDESYYGVVIHEIREMQIMNMGQYAHGNQPIQHMLYLYDYAGQPWKTQYWVRQVMDKLYSAAPDGYCGDEDNGQTSAWYVFSAMGFYSVCPGTQQYALGAPLFPKMLLTVEGGKKFRISAPANNEKNIYVQRALLNGRVYDKNWIGHFDLRQGGSLELLMGPGPRRDGGWWKPTIPIR